MRAILVSALCLALGACAGFNPWASAPSAYVVFFDGHSTALAAAGKDIVAHAAATARLKPGVMVQIAGPSTKIAPGYNPRFAQPRIDAVTAELVADGVAVGRIVQTSITTDKVKVDASGAQRVEIRIVEPGA